MVRMRASSYFIFIFIWTTVVLVSCFGDKIIHASSFKQSIILNPQANSILKRHEMSLSSERIHPEDLAILRALIETQKAEADARKAETQTVDEQKRKDEQKRTAYQAILNTVTGSLLPDRRLTGYILRAKESQFFLLQSQKSGPDHLDQASWDDVVGGLQPLAFFRFWQTGASRVQSSKSYLLLIRSGSEITSSSRTATSPDKPEELESKQEKKLFWIGQEEASIASTPLPTETTPALGASLEKITENLISLGFEEESVRNYVEGFKNFSPDVGAIAGPALMELVQLFKDSEKNNGGLTDKEGKLHSKRNDDAKIPKPEWLLGELWSIANAADSMLSSHLPETEKSWQLESIRDFVEYQSRFLSNDPSLVLPDQTKYDAGVPATAEELEEIRRQFEPSGK